MSSRFVTTTWRSRMFATALGLAVLVAAIFAGVGGQPDGAAAASFTVNTTIDTVDASPGNGICADAAARCSLRAAVLEANALAGPDTITIPAGTYTLAIAGVSEDAALTGDLDITGDTVFTAAGQGVTTIDAASLDRAFHVFPGVTVSFTGLRITNGLVPGPLDGGGILNNSADVTITNSRFDQNLAPTFPSTGGAVAAVGASVTTITGSIFELNDAYSGGGAVSSGGGSVLNIGASTFTSNSSVDGGGAIYSNGPTTNILGATFVANTSAVGGAIHSNSATLSIANSTFSNNSANNSGAVDTRSGSTTITNSTFAGNLATASDFGDSVGNQDAFGGFTTVTNSIMSGSTVNNCRGTITDGGSNIRFPSGANCPGTLVDPLLGPLANNGGPTQTIRPLPGSPAIDAGDNTVCATTPVNNRDQRAVRRPIDGDSVPGATCDIGAFETGFVVNATGDAGDASAGDGICETAAPAECTLRAAIEEANALSGADAISFNIPGGGVQTITIGTDLYVYDTVTIDGSTQPLASCGGAGMVGRNLLIQVVGASGFSGITLNGSATNGSTVRGLAMSGFTTAGAAPVRVSGSNNSSVSCNNLGTNPAGTAAQANFWAIEVQGATNTVIGGTNPGDGNLISGQIETGLFLAFGAGPSNVLGNHFGTDVTGTAAITNGSGGFGASILVISSGNTIGGTDANARNVLSGSYQGIRLDGASNVIIGNYIGLNAAGTTALPNLSGIQVSTGANNVIGGSTAAERNVVSGNQFDGIRIDNPPATGNVVKGNYIGVDATGTFARPNSAGINLAGGTTGNIIGGSNPGEGNLISGNDSGLYLQNVGTSSNVVKGNIIGLDATGTTAIPNSFGLTFANGASSNTIGGPAAGDRNIISGNTTQGLIVGVGSASNTIEGNYIGLDATGTAAVPNGKGVDLITPASGNVVRGNVISGNLQYGLTVSSAVAGNTVAGNKIGTNAAGTAAVPNIGPGMRVFDSTSLVIGGTTGLTPGGACTADCNLISGNTGPGLLATNPNTGLLIQGNHIGTDLAGTAAIANGTEGILLTSAGTTTTIRANLISGNASFGIFVSGTNSTTIAGNRVGTDTTGTSAIPNGSNAGIRVFNSPNTIIGGTVGVTPGGSCTGDCNLVSGNTGKGIFLGQGAQSGIFVQNNFVGTNLSGTAALGNGTDGITVDSPSILIVEGNVVSGNADDGISSDWDGLALLIIRGNRIGTNSAGTAAVANGTGIEIGAPSLTRASDYVTIGGTGVGEGNLISGNSGDGILIEGYDNDWTAILGNRIGTNAAGTAAVPNSTGITLGGGPIVLPRNSVSSTDNTIIGDGTVAGRNIISGNTVEGIALWENVTNTSVRGNYVGVAADGVSALGNPGGSGGIVMRNWTAGNTIGGNNAGDGNIIANNAVGVAVFSGPRHRIVGNSIFDNSGLGILINGAAVNDPGDPDGDPSEAANQLQNFPVISNAYLLLGNIFADFSVDSTLANATYPIQVDFYRADSLASGEGQSFVARTSLAAPGATNFNLGDGDTINVSIGDPIVATATDALGNSSQFSVPVQVSAFSGAQTFTVTNTNGSGAGSLLQAILDANANTGQHDTIAFNIAGAGPHIILPGSDLPPISDPVTIDGYSQPGSVVNSQAVGSNAVLQIALVADYTQSYGLAFAIGSDGSIVRGINFQAWPSAAILLENTSGVVVKGNYIGTNILGTSSGGDSIFGVQVFGASNNTIGGVLPADRNLVSGIGTPGCVGCAGVLIEDDGSTVSTGNRIIGNYIGTAASGSAALGNTGNGVSIQSAGNFVGGILAGEGNVIGSNTNAGIAFETANSGSNTVQGNLIGLAANTDTSVPNSVGVSLFSDSGSNLIGGSVPAAANRIESNTVRGVEAIASPNNTIAGNLIVGNGFSGTGEGVYLGSNGNTVGGVATNERNIISGNAGDGVFAGGSGNVISGNYIGTNTNGSSTFGNARGVTISGATSATVRNNLISANYGSGIVVSSSTLTTIAGNRIGTTASGAVALPNAASTAAPAIAVSDSTSTTIGGTNGITVNGDCTGDCNLVSGNNNLGIQVGGISTASAIRNNFIGANVTGMAALGNAGAGIFATATSGITIDGNLVSGNTGAGIASSGSSTLTIIRNKIGTNTGGTGVIPNALGIDVNGGSTVTIGSIGEGDGNIIANSAADGVRVAGNATGVGILGNSIHSNGDPNVGNLGIDLENDGVTPNDSLDDDSGANDLANFPVIGAAPIAGTSPVAITLQSSPSNVARVELFASPVCDAAGFGEGRTYLGFATATANGAGFASFTITPGSPTTNGEYLTATATNPGNNTSEFSACVQVGSAAADGVSATISTTSTLVGPGAFSVPINQIPIAALATLNSKVSGVPLNSIDLSSSALRDIPLNSIPLNSISVSGLPLDSIPLDSIPLNSITWEHLLLGTPLENVPITSLTLADVRLQAAGTLASITIGDADLLASSLRNISLAALVLGDLPLNSIGTVTCATCTPSQSLVRNQIQGTPLDSISIDGVPLDSIPLDSIPLNSIPLNSIQLGALPLDSIPLNSIALGSIGLSSTRLAGTLIGSAPLNSINLPGGFCDWWAANGESCATDGVTASTTLLGLVTTLEGQGRTPSSTPLNSIPLDSIPLNSIPLNSIPLNSIPLNSIAVGGLPLDSIPLNSIMTSTTLNSIPLNSIPLNSIPLNSIPLNSIPLNSIPLNSILLGAPLNSIPLNSIRLEDTPLNSIPLNSIPLAATPSAADWCALIALVSAPATCTSLNLTDQSSILQLKRALQEAGIAASPLNSIPLNSILVGTPLNSIPLNSIPLDSIPLNSIPLNSIPLDSIFLSAPLNSIPLNSIPLNSIPLNSIPLNSIATIVDCGLVSCTAGTLGDAKAAGALIPGVTPAMLAAAFTPAATINGTLASYFGEISLGDLQLAWQNTTGLVLGDLGPLSQYPQFNGMTVGQLTSLLSGPLTFFLAAFYPEETLGQVQQDGAGFGGLTLADIIRISLAQKDYPWEELPLDTLGVTTFGPSGSEVAYTINFVVDAGTAGFVTTVTATLPPGFTYKPGTSTRGVVSGPSGNVPAAPMANPVITGQDLQWTLTGVVNGDNNALGFTARPGLRLGSNSVRATVQVGSNTGSQDGAVVTVAEPFEGFLPSDGGINNNAVATALVVTPDVLYVGDITSADDVDYYRVAIPVAGSRVTVFMSNLNTDLDIVMYSPVQPPLLAAGLHVPLQSVPIGDNGGGPISTPLEPETIQDIDLDRLPVIAASTNRTTIDERIEAISVGIGGDYIIKVTGYNGAFSDVPYILRVKVTPPENLPICTPRTFAFGGQGVVGTSTAVQGGVKTLFLTNQKRLGDTYGAAAAANVLLKLNQLAGYVAPAPNTAVAGAIVAVDSLPGYAAFDSNPCDYLAANALVEQIGSQITAWKAANPALENIVIVGSDEIIPFARVPDLTRISNERDYASTFDDHRGAIYGSLISGHILSDDPYGDADPIPWLERHLYVPDIAVGRLVETPADITAAVDRYITNQGFINPTTGLSTGYDFLTDGSLEVAANLDAQSWSTGGVQNLINETWNAANLSAAMLGASPPGVISLNSHFDHYRALPADQNSTGSEAQLFNSRDIAVAGGLKLLNAVLFSMGCHAGLSVADSVIGSPLDPRAGDWAQTFAGEGAIFIGNTGYGYGDSATVALSERLMVYLARRLDGRQSVGLSLTMAKQDYFGGLGMYGVYDEKALMQVTYFGLPMYRIGIPGGAVPPAPVLPQLSSPTLDGATSLPSKPISISINFGSTPTNTTRGSFYEPNSASYTPSGGFTGGGTTQPVLESGSQQTQYRPIEPRITIDVTQPNTKAHGALITNLVSTDEPFDPIYFQPVVDLTSSAAEPVVESAIFPTRFQNISTFTAEDSPSPDGLRQNLILVPGQFISNGGTTGIHRKFSEMDTTIYYSNDDDYLQPTLHQMDALVVNGVVNISVVTTDDTLLGTGVVKRVFVLVLDQTGTWQPLELVLTDGNRWTGSMPVIGTEVFYFVQAVDASGNVAASSNKGVYFLADSTQVIPPVPPTGTSIDLALTGLQSNGTFAEPVTVTATGTASLFDYSLDGAEFAALPPAGVIVGTNGVHTLVVRGSDGAEDVATFVVALVELPGANFITPFAGASYATGQKKKANYSCSSPAGVVSCTGTVPLNAYIDTATPGLKSFSVTVLDGANITRTIIITYTVADACSLTPTINGTTGSETINGTTGDDIIFGRGGNDIIFGRGGDDIICAGGGNDKITAGAGNDVIVSNGGNDEIDGGSGDDAIFAGEGNDKIKSAGGNDHIDAGNGDNKVEAGAGNNTVISGAGHDEIITLGGNDVITAGGGNNKVEAGAGDNTVTTGAGSDKITTLGGLDTIYAGDGNNEIHAGDGHNHVTSGGGNDKITSLGGNDTILAGGGLNTIDAGAGNNTITTGSSNDKITTQGGDDVISAGDGNNDIQAGAGNNTITSGAGNDKITALGGNDTINAGAGNNEIDAGAGNNTITTLGGSDKITTGGGTDVINAGAGNNKVESGGGSDTIDGGPGNDNFNGGPGTDTCRPGGGVNTVTGCELS